MAELVPFPFDRLLTHAFAELETSRALFHLPAKKFVRGVPGKDLAVQFHGHTASSPLGPAAGPQSQLAQNIALSFLGGGRIFELKTVQIMDRLQIPRPCIDAQTVGYNVEWSQELTLEQSLEEYVKASMLIEILIASGKLELAPGFDQVIFDMSVGYDLAGIKSERVQAFLHGMLDASAVVERLRRQIPDSLRQYRELEFRTRLSDTLTLSTFHGCPPDEIERIIEFLLERLGLHSIVKLNPTLLGKHEVRRILNEVLGYPDHAPDDAFDKDASWQQAEAFVGRLGEKARGLGLGFGVKFSNTLIVENQRSFFPESEKVMYLSGQPLHVLAMSLVKRFRESFGDRYPISFSAGIDAKNFPDAVSLGLVPVTVCTDLLRPGGYGRMELYFRELATRMGNVRADNLGDFIIRARGRGETTLERAGGGGNAAARQALAEGGALAMAAGPALYAAWVAAARVDNTLGYVDALLTDPRYTRAGTDKPPKKVGSLLVLFDCLTCDKCIPVCPNDANFSYQLPAMELPIEKATRSAAGVFEVRNEGTLTVAKKHQIANFADFCNECGNCDVFCPEDGGPYVLKPRFFGSAEQFALHTGRDGFFVERRERGFRVLGRFASQDFAAIAEDGRARYSGLGFDLSCDAAAPASSLSGSATAEVDLTYLRLMLLLGRSVLEESGATYVGSGTGS
ncbi:MAG: glutamate synthase [Myxococcales bacterium]|nr:glutamate synthase [Myxococcales bacterium]